MARGLSRECYQRSACGNEIAQGRLTKFTNGLIIYITCIVCLLLIVISFHGPVEVELYPNTARTTNKDRQHLESEVFDENHPVAQNDERLLDYIRKYHLNSPSEEPDNSSPAGERIGTRNKLYLYIKKIFNNMRNGFFVELGAGGDHLSTSICLILEREFGWTGLLIESNDSSYATLLTKHRKAWTSNICVSTVNHPIEIVKQGEVSSIGKHCVPIFSVLAALKTTTVDFFVMNTSGAELDILKTIPFEYVLIKIFSIKGNHSPEDMENLSQFLESKSYTFVKEFNNGSPRDLIFAHKSTVIHPW